MSPANVAFRVDASLEIGNGHVMRCLALADALAERGRSCRFLCQERTGHLGAVISSRGHDLTLLPEHSDWSADAMATISNLGLDRREWLVVDHYGLDRNWELQLRPHCGRLMVIDDLANRPHDCDLLLDQGRDPGSSEYHSLLSESATLLLGPQFALLRPEFAELRPLSLARRTEGELRRILVSMGGVDMANVSTRVLRALGSCQALRKCEVDVILGPNAPWTTQVAGLVTQLPYPCQLHRDPPDVATLMARSDLCIGAAGTTSWERCCLGLPSIVVSVAANQDAVAARLVASGAAIAMLDLADLEAQLVPAIEAIPVGAALLRASLAASLVCKGDGTRQVTDHLTRAHGGH